MAVGKLPRRDADTLPTSKVDPVEPRQNAPRDDERVERAAQALCRFVFPGSMVPRMEMARAAVAAMDDPEADLPERVVVDNRTGPQATLDYVLNCIEGDRFKDSMGQTASWYVGYSLGQSAHLYHCESFAAVVAERDHLRTAYERLAEAMGHVINRVSTERRDDEHGHIFLAGKEALRWADAESRGEQPVTPDESSQSER